MGFIYYGHTAFLSTSRSEEPSVDLSQTNFIYLPYCTTMLFYFMLCAPSVDITSELAIPFNIALFLDSRKWDSVSNLTEARSDSTVANHPAGNSSIPTGLIVAGGRSNRFEASLGVEWTSGLYYNRRA